MIINDKNAAMFLRWLDDPVGAMFLEWIGELNTVPQKILQKEEKPVELYRAQGKSEAYNRILGLKKECQDILKKGHS